MLHKPEDNEQRKSDAAIRQELELIRSKSKGVLYPQDVVEFARDPNTELHKHFTWDDSEAARQYRLEEARRLIRVHVTYLPRNNQPVPCYISLPEKRANGGGYITIEHALSKAEYRRQMLEDALVALQALENRYHMLRELAPIWDAVDKVRSRFKSNGKA